LSSAVERDLLPMAEALDLTVTTWEPLGAGLLTGRYGTDRARPENTRITTTEYAGARLTERNLGIADVVNAVAAERGASPAQVAIAWLRAQRQG
jgi:aryl-alcohol dehydrogenase-like predicted oxidoreductase